MKGTDGLHAIEFFGLPGAGKTTLAEQVIANLRTRGRSVVSSREWMGDGRSFLARTSRRLAMVLRELMGHPSLLLEDGARVISECANLKEGLHSGWNQLSVSAMVRRSRRSRPLLVLDQGLVQAAWSTGMRQDRRSEAPALHRIDPLWLRQSLFVEVTTPVEQARGWLAQRNDRTSRLQRAAEIDDPARWSRGAELMRDLSESLHLRLAAVGLEGRLLQLSSTDGPPDELAAQVIRHFDLNERQLGESVP